MKKSLKYPLVFWAVIVGICVWVWFLFEMLTYGWVKTYWVVILSMLAYQLAMLTHAVSHLGAQAEQVFDNPSSIKKETQDNG